MKPTIYLAGAIRDGRPEDISWREDAIEALSTQAIILNPVAGKRFDPLQGRWTMHGLQPGGEVLIAHDGWCVDHADILIANFLALSEKYPNIGTLTEWGRAWGRPNILKYAIVPPSYCGHSNGKMYALHPFIQNIASVIFPNVRECLEFTAAHLAVLSGTNPHYAGRLPVEVTHGS